MEYGSASRGGALGPANIAGGSKSRNNCVTETGLAAGAAEGGAIETGCGRSFAAISAVAALLSGVGGAGGAGISCVSRACALYCFTQPRSAVSSGNLVTR
jgi:hypothetical protein